MSEAMAQAGGGLAALGEASAVRVEEHRVDAGSLRLWRQPGVRIDSARVVGYFSSALAQPLIDYVDPLFEGGRVLGLHDWFLMTGCSRAAPLEAALERASQTYADEPSAARSS